MNKVYKALPAHRGLVVAKSWVLKNHEIDNTIIKIKSSEVDSEINKFKSALKTVIADIKDSIITSQKKLGKEKSQIFEGHLIMARDEIFTNEVIETIKNSLVSAKNAVLDYEEKYYQIFSKLENKYMSERARDLKSITHDVLINILGLKKQDISKIKEEVIIVAHDITPAETVYINTEYVKGIINEIGATTSHVVILAKSLDIPTVVGFSKATSIIKNGEEIILNGKTGEVILEPDAKSKKAAQKSIIDQKAHKEYIKKLIDKPAITLDGHKVGIEANIGSISDAIEAKKVGAEGVGLFRSEFLYMQADNWPSEEIQFQTYKETVKQFPNNIVIVRTLDIGGDKNLSYYEFEKELNPFLGGRAIRFCLKNPKIFKTQLTALIKASAHGQIAIMVPMVSTIGEIKKTRQIIESIKADFIKKNIKFNKNILLGIMVEVPSTAISADIFAKYVDFFSIGTNDLIQYIFAADRMGQNVSYLYQPLNVTILRLIKNVIEASHKNNIWTAVCGSMAGSTKAIPLLLGMGLDYFSVPCSLVLEVKYLIRKMNYSDCQELLRKCLEKEIESEIIDLVDKYLDSLDKNDK